ncbi:MAG: right-handed parallel beta-helix repeat-containing protein [Actinomycetota bacterium]
MLSLLVLQGITIGTAAGASVSAAPSCDQGAYALLVSETPDRAGASALCGQQVSGEVYVFLSPATGPTKVEFSLDGVREQVEKKSPWDFGGGKLDSANPWDASTASTGDHVISAQIFVGSTLSSTSSATFSVSGSAPPSSPPPPPPPSSLPAPPVPTGPCVGVGVPSGGNIQAAIDAHPTGTTFCLSGTYQITRTITPHTGDVLRGPAFLFGNGRVEEGISTDKARGVVIDGLDISGFALRAVRCGEDAVIQSSNLHDNGRNGIGCGLNGSGGLVISGNHIFDNGDPAFTGGGSGGIKIAGADGALIEDNLIERNIGNGVWCDVDCGAITIRNNVVRGSTRKGIFVEISRGPALIENNTVMYNNCSPVFWPNPKPACDLGDGTFGPQSSGAPGGGIAANSSVRVIIRNNILGGNMVAGINFRDDSRPYNAPFQITVSGNVLNGDRMLNCDIPVVSCSS